MTLLEGCSILKGTLQALVPELLIILAKFWR